MARSFMVGMPSGRIFPLVLGMFTLRSGRGRYLTFSRLAIAACFCCGVSHSCRSTPGVRFPWFSVTRFTASAFALNERVSHRCRDFTLRQSPSDVAFAKRCCMIRTFRWIWRQSIAAHSFGACEDAESPCWLITFIAVPRRLTCRGRISPRRDKLRPFEALICLCSRMATISPDGSLLAFAMG